MTFLRCLSFLLLIGPAAAWASDKSSVSVSLRPASGTPLAGYVEMASADGTSLFVSAEEIISDAHIESAAIGFDAYTGSPVVKVRLTEEGARKVADYTAAHTGELIAIVVDGQLVSAPMVREPTLGGQIQISGNLTEEEAKRIADGLNGYSQTGMSD